MSWVTYAKASVTKGVGVVTYTEATVTKGVGCGMSEVRSLKSEVRSWMLGVFREKRIWKLSLTPVNARSVSAICGVWDVGCLKLEVEFEMDSDFLLAGKG